VRHSWLQVRLRLLSTAEGGKTKPIYSDYRPHWNTGATWTGAPVLSDARVMLEDRDALHPGEECIARLEPLFPEFWDQVRVGAALTMHEGSRELGHATVLAVG
jgi:hypothetical protein